MMDNWRRDGAVLVWLSSLAVLAVGAGPGRASARDAPGTERKPAGMTVAILVADAFEQVELTGPRKVLEAAGAKTVLVAPHPGQVRAWNMANWGDMYDVDRPLGQVRPEQFDALLLPGGVGNPDLLRVNGDAVKFVRACFEAGRARGRQMTSWPSLQTDLRNAGAAVVDEAAVVDGNLVTSRGPQGIPAFNTAMIALFAEARPGAAGS